MRLLIVVTVPAYELVDLRSEDWRSDQIAVTCKVRSRVVGEDRIVAIFQAQGESESESREQTTAAVTEIASSLAYPDAEIYVAGHMGFVDLDDIREKVGIRVAAGVSFSHYPKAPGLDPISDVLYHLMRELTPEAYQTALDSIKTLDGASRAQRFATISHQLIRLFLPIVFDLGSWRAMDYDQDFSDRIIRTYQNGQSRLAQARAHLYKGAGTFPDTLERIIDEAGLARDQDWQCAKLLIPRHQPIDDARRDQAELYFAVFHEQDVLGCLKDREGMLKLKLMLEQDDVFGRWSSELKTVLTSLKRKIEDRPPPTSSEPLSRSGAGQRVD